LEAFIVADIQKTVNTILVYFVIPLLIWLLFYLLVIFGPIFKIFIVLETFSSYNVMMDQSILYYVIQDQTLELSQPERTYIVLSILYTLLQAIKTY